MDVSHILTENEVKTTRQVQFHSQYLCAFDSNPIDNLLEDTTETCQIIVSNLFKNIQVDNGVFSILEKRRILPRFKQMKPRQQTKWEKFAQAKGIQNKKKQRVQYNEETEDYRPTHGYKNYGKEEKDMSGWLKEVKHYEDPFEQEREDKKKRVEKNEGQRLKNQRMLQAQTSTASLGKHFDGKKVLKKEKDFEYDSSKISMGIVGGMDGEVVARKAVKTLK